MTFRYIVVDKGDITFDDAGDTALVKVPQYYKDDIRADERNKINQEYMAEFDRISEVNFTPCFMCGPDNWTTAICEDCLAENEKEIEDE